MLCLLPILKFSWNSLLCEDVGQDPHKGAFMTDFAADQIPRKKD